MLSTTPPLYADIEQTIAQALSMQSGFPKAAVALWAKVIRAALEPQLLSPVSHGAVETISIPAVPVASKDDGQLRLEAVMDFSRYLLAKGDDEQTPNEYALESLVNGWNELHNGKAKLPEQISMDAGTAA